MYHVMKKKIKEQICENANKNLTILLRQYLKKTDYALCIMYYEDAPYVGNPENVYSRLFIYILLQIIQKNIVM